MAGEATATAMMFRRHFCVSVLGTAALLLPSCSSSHPDRIVVGSKNFTESFVLGEIIAKHI
jgi:glycine betaine/choline ABC-type transport system substrate-binding protein